jgi:hypothetical protein
MEGLLCLHKNLDAVSCLRVELALLLLQIGAVPLALLPRIEPEAPPEEVKRLRRRVLSTIPTSEPRAPGHLCTGGVAKAPMCA